MTLLVDLASGFVCAPARAEDQPFQLDSGSWKSSAHYKEAVERGTIVEPEAKPDSVAEDKDAEDSTQASPIQDPALAAAAAAAATAQPAPALTRALDLPGEPALNKGFNLQVDSTEEEKINAAALAPAPAPNAGPPEKAWESVTKVSARKSSGSDDDEDQPLNVRMSLLPAQNISLIPDAAQKSAQQKGRIAMEKSAAAKAKMPPKTAAEIQACAAIDAYKKQQLEAIQSDRETLKALQEAIHTLGLGKQLSFMSGDNKDAAGAAGQSSANATGGAPSLIDKPLSTVQ